MAHHGDGLPPEMEHFERFRKALDEDKAFFGKTGEYPQGKMIPSDEGELRFGVAHDNGKVVLNFGKPVAWIGMDPKQAVELAQMLLDHARQTSDDVLTISL